MLTNGKWDNPKVVMYCQIGKALDMAKFSINSAIQNVGMKQEDFDLVFVCWKTSDEVYNWLKQNNYKYVDMQYDEGKGFLWNLYKGWNIGYEIAFNNTNADYVCPIATDHAFYKNWLYNLYKHGAKNRIVNCKLIEPGTLPSLHTCYNFGVTLDGQFREQEFLAFAEKLYISGQNKLILDEKQYTHRLDAMPFLCSKEVWQKYGPMLQTLNALGITGDTDFFDRCKAGGVEITKSLDGISYHCGGLETRRNTAAGTYT